MTSHPDLPTHLETTALLGCSYPIALVRIGASRDGLGHTCEWRVSRHSIPNPRLTGQGVNSV